MIFAPQPALPQRENALCARTCACVGHIGGAGWRKRTTHAGLRERWTRRRHEPENALRARTYVSQIIHLMTRQRKCPTRADLRPAVFGLSFRSLTGAPTSRGQHFHHISRVHSSAMQDSGKHALPGHNTISHRVEYLAVVMALLANLRHFQKHVITAQACPHGQGRKVNAVHNKIFPEAPVRNHGSSGPECLNGLPGKQADLTMPLSGMGIALNAVVHHKFRRRNGRFGCTLFGAGTDGLDHSHTISLWLKHLRLEPSDACMSLHQPCLLKAVSAGGDSLNTRRTSPLPHRVSGGLFHNIKHKSGRSAPEQ